MKMAGWQESSKVKLMQVMLIVNIDLQNKLVNGQLGNVIHIAGNSEGISKIYLTFNDTRARVKALNVDIFGNQNSWVPITKTEVDIKIKSSKNSSPFIKRIQYPLMLTWRCTVHKVQGLSLDNIVVILDLLRKRSFNYGQIYVALSRVTSFNGLYIVGIFSRKVRRADPRVL